MKCRPRLTLFFRHCDRKAMVMQHSLTTCDLKSFTQDSKGYSSDLRQPVSSSNWAAPGI